MQRKKHILLAVRHPVGGIRTFLRYVYSNFDAQKWQFTIVAPKVDLMKIILEDLVMHEMSWVKVSKSAGYLEMTRSITKQLFMNEYDLVHSHGFTAAMCAAVPVYARRIPHLMTSHEALNKNQFLSFKGNLKLRGMGSLFTLIDRVQSVSHDAQDNLLSFFPRLGEKNGRCLVIPSGIESNRFLYAQKINLRAELQLCENTFLIGFFGRFMNPKGFFYLIEAIEILMKRKNHLVKQPIVITVGEGGFLSREKRLIKQKGLENSFRHLPFSPNIAGLIKGVDVVIMPSLWEACGLLAMETLVCGTPLIASNCIGLREVTQGTPAINIPMRDSQAIAKEITTLMEKPQKEIFKSYSSLAAQRFDVKVQTLKLVGLYNQLIKQKA